MIFPENLLKDESKKKEMPSMLGGCRKLGAMPGLTWQNPARPIFANRPASKYNTLLSINH
jgi:hypothetical protein